MTLFMSRCSRKQRFNFLTVHAWPVVLLLGSLLLTFSRPGLASESVTRVYFGMHIHNADAGTAWPDLPFGAWRLWDAHVTWRDIQPEPARWAFKRLDRYVAMARITHTDLLLPLGLTPQWASSRPLERSSYAPGNAAEPRELSDWQRYVEAVVRRYAGRISAYEIWNEPNLSGFFSGDVDAMVRLTCEAYRIVKQADPKAIVVSPSATHQMEGIEWFELFLERGGRKCFDVVGFHFYTLAHEPPEKIVPLARKLHAVMEKHGIGKLPIWNTESGWYIANRRIPVGVRWRVLNDEEAAAYVARALILGWAEGIRRFYWYAWDDSKLGLLETENGTLKPAARAYAKTARWMDNIHGITCKPSNQDVMVCQMDGQGKHDWIVWSMKQKTKFSIPPNWRSARIETLKGYTGKLHGHRLLELDGSPVLVSLE